MIFGNTGRLHDTDRLVWLILDDDFRKRPYKRDRLKLCEALIHIRQKEQITDSQGRSELGLVTRFYSAVHTSNACLSLMCNVFSLLSSKNFAHQLFKRMSNKNSRTYEAMILSLLKVIIEYTWEHRLLMFRVAILSIFYSVVTD